MDIAITKKKTPNLKRYLFLFLLALTVLSAARYLWFLSQADYNVDRNTLVFAEVKQGQFAVSVRGTGVLVPNNIQWVSASVDAKVEKLAVKAGNIVNTGDLIVELNNPQLVQQLAEAQWELEAQEAEAKAAEIAEELALLDQKASVLNDKMNYESRLLRKKAESQLLSTGAVSKLDYDRTVLETEQFKQRWLIGQQQLAKMQENLLGQSNARTARLNKTRKSLERVQEEVDNLQVKATMDSIVLEMPLQAGQRIAMGSNIAKLAQQDSLIAELQVPEIQIREVAVGQTATVDTRNNKIEGVVSRVDPAVINGNVQVDIVFSESLPDDARPDLSVDGEIRIVDIENTLYVDRPLFVQSKSHSVFYKLNDDGQFAERTEVEVGHGSVGQVQIIEGLKPGDRIVTSDPTGFDNYQKFRIN